MGDLSQCCIKVYTLEKILKLKKDPISQVVFLDEAMKASAYLYATWNRAKSLIGDGKYAKCLLLDDLGDGFGEAMQGRGEMCVPPSPPVFKC
jgi:hypothetical protein